MLDRLIEIIQDIFSNTDAPPELIYANDADKAIDTLLDAIKARGFDLSAFSASDIQEALREAMDQNGLLGHEISFKGLTAIEPLADLQVGPTCGFEAIENFIQLNDPGYTNTLSDYLQRSELFDRGGHLVTGGMSLDPFHYQHILSDFGIQTQWHQFSHNDLAQAIDDNRGVLAIGDAHYLDPATYPSKHSYHAFIITDITRGPLGNIICYKGIDSNLSQQEAHWSPEAIERALKNSSLLQPMLISLQEMKWPYKTT